MGDQLFAEPMVHALCQQMLTLVGWHTRWDSAREAIPQRPRRFRTSIVLCLQRFQIVDLLCTPQGCASLVRGFGRKEVATMVRNVVAATYVKRERVKTEDA